MKEWEVFQIQKEGSDLGQEKHVSGHSHSVQPAFGTH